MKKFEIQIDGADHLLELGKCAIKLFREKQDVDHVIIYNQDKRVRGFGNALMCRYIAGYMIGTDEEGDLTRSTVVFNDKTFREVHGWNPLVIEAEAPSREEEDAWANVATHNLDDEWKAGLE